MPMLLVPQGPITGTNNMKEARPRWLRERNPEDLLNRKRLAVTNRVGLLLPAVRQTPWRCSTDRILNSVFSTWRVHGAQQRTARIPCHAIHVNGFRVQLWEALQNSRKRKIAAHRSFGAKNQLL